MIHYTEAFNGYSVDDLGKAKKFYGEVLGLPVTPTEEGLSVDLKGQKVFMYPKPNHEPATYTVLNLKVADIQVAVADLKKQDVKFEQYPNPKTDPDGIARVPKGPLIAWFKDPAGNILSVIQEKHQ
jgi:predicted enzyme related to lactoylglutathione lyase